MIIQFYWEVCLFDFLSHWNFSVSLLINFFVQAPKFSFEFNSSQKISSTENSEKKLCFVKKLFKSFQQLHFCKTARLQSVLCNFFQFSRYWSHSFASFLLPIKRQTQLTKTESQPFATNHTSISIREKKLIISHFEDRWNTLEVFFFSTEFESQALVITVPIRYKEAVSPRSSLTNFLQDKTAFAKNRKFLHGPNTSLNDEIKTQEASVSAASSVTYNSNHRNENKTCESVSSKPPRRKDIVLNDPVFLISNVVAPTVKPSSEPDLHRDDALEPQMSTEKIQFKSQSTSLYIVSTPYQFQLNQNRLIDHYILYSSD